MAISSKRTYQALSRATLCFSVRLAKGCAYLKEILLLSVTDELDELVV